MKKKILKRKPTTAEKRKSPVSVGEEYDVEIEKQKAGYGVCFVKEFPILVRDAEIGESAHVQIIKVKADHAIARVMSSEEPFHVGENLKDELRGLEEKAASGELEPPADEGEAEEY